MSCQATVLSCQSPLESGRAVVMTMDTATARGLRGAAGQLSSLAQGVFCWQQLTALGNDKQLPVIRQSPRKQCGERDLGASRCQTTCLGN